MRSLPTTAAGAALLAAAMFTPTGVAHAYAGACFGPADGGNVIQVREFSMQDTGGGSSLVTIAAEAAMSQADAQTVVNGSVPRPDFFVFGDDSGSDDLLAQFRPDRVWVSPVGVGMRGATQVSNAELNEDGMGGGFPPKPDADYFENDRNEYFGEIRMGGAQPNTAHRIETCRLHLPR